MNGKQDPLALAFFGAALALIAGLLLYLLFGMSRDPAPAGPGTAERIRKFVDEARPKPAPPKAVAVQPTPGPPAAKAASDNPWRALAGRTWRYSVTVEPEAWKNAELTYRMSLDPDGLGVRTDFVHAGGKMAFRLGIFEPNHPTHANTRFPGFFMYPAYFAHPLRGGDRIVFAWPWQGGSGGTTRVKRFEGRVAGYDGFVLKGKSLQSARIEGTLSYVEGNEVKATVRETVWYALEVGQIVKILREGKSPDEGVTRIYAELVEFRQP